MPLLKILLPLKMKLSVYPIQRISHEGFPVKGYTRKSGNYNVYLIYIAILFFFLGNERNFLDKPVNVYNKEIFNKHIVMIHRGTDGGVNHLKS